MAHPSWSPPVYMETSELTADELVPPSSRILASLRGFSESFLLMDGKEIISRMLRTGLISSMMGRNKGKQAPTIPSEDSTIGQYTVGVNMSFHHQVSRCSSILGFQILIHVKSSSPEKDS